VTTMSLEEQEALGHRVGGDVDLRSFDEGIVVTMGGKIINNQYYVEIDGITPPSGEPGIPVTFSVPEDLFANQRLPMFVITRDDISVATSRFHFAAQKYRAPAKTGLPVTVQTPNGPKHGYTQMVDQWAATPYDITYTINAYHTLRGGFGGKRAANKMLTHILQVFPGFTQVYVKDSHGYWRTYEAFQEGVATFDDTPNISERIIQYGVTVRVEAEYDLSLPVVSPTVTKQPVANYTVKPKE
jgi:hypothetical protein